MEIIIKKSTNSKKKFDAVIDGKKKISFGQAGASDFTKHKDDDRKNLILTATKRTKTGAKMELIPLASGRLICYGTRKH